MRKMNKEIKGSSLNTENPKYIRVQDRHKLSIESLKNDFRHRSWSGKRHSRLSRKIECTNNQNIRA